MTITYPSIIFLFVEGQTLEFSREQILNAALVEEINTLSTEISINTLEFEIYASNDTFSMFSGSSYALLMERLPILAYESVDGSTRLLGKFYLDKWKNSSERKMEFMAYDIIGILNDTDFDGVFWETPVTFDVALLQIFSPINVSFELDASLSSVLISGWIPSGTYRDVLQQLCFSARATVVTARRETLLIIPVVLPDQLYATRIKDSEKSNKQSVELLPLISTIEIVSHNYAQSLTVETIFDKYLEAGSYKIIFDKPYTDIIITGPGYTQSVLGTEGNDYIATENGDYLEAGGEYNINSNSVYLTISVAGQVTITGYSWIDSKQSFIFTETGAVEAQNKNTILISDATLINIDNGQTVLDITRDYYRQRYSQNIKLLPSEIKVSDIVLSNTLYQNKILGSVQKMVTDLTEGFLSQTNLRGIVPVYILPAVSPTRRARAGLTISDAGLTRNNQWRQYA